MRYSPYSYRPCSTVRCSAKDCQNRVPLGWRYCTSCKEKMRQDPKPIPLEIGREMDLEDKRERRRRRKF